MPPVKKKEGLGVKLIKITYFQNIKISNLFGLHTFVRIFYIYILNHGKIMLTEINIF